MKRCIIHIGMHKTGSTSIQHSLYKYADQEYFYADLDEMPNHSLAVFSLYSRHPEAHHLHRGEGRDAARIREYINGRREGLKRSIEAAKGRTLIISGEDIGILPQVALADMQKDLQSYFDTLTIVGYVRSPVGFMTSAFQEQTKGGTSNHIDLETTYRNYQALFGKFDVVFGRENVRLWKFDPASFPGGCVVQDFCSRLNISFPLEKIIRMNESLTRQAVGLLYTFRKLGRKYDGKIMMGGEAQQLAVSLAGIHGDKLRFSPDIVRPVLEKNRADIEWMEARLGQSLQEDLGEHRTDDVRDESDLLRPDPEVVSKLLELLGDSAPHGVKGDSPEEVALLVHVLRKRRDTAMNVNELIEQMRQKNPKLLEGIPEARAVALLRGVFEQMNATLAGLEDGVVKYVGLGQFRARKIEKEVDGEKISQTRIMFNSGEPVKGKKIAAAAPGAKNP